jgi:hypothetical protein
MNPDVALLQEEACRALDQLTRILERGEAGMVEPCEQVRRSYSRFRHAYDQWESRLPESLPPLNFLTRSKR